MVFIRSQLYLSCSNGVLHGTNMNERYSIEKLKYHLVTLRISMIFLRSKIYYLSGPNGIMNG